VIWTSAVISALAVVPSLYAQGSVSCSVIGTTGTAPTITKTVQFVVTMYNSTIFCQPIMSNNANCNIAGGGIPAAPTTVTRMVVAMRTASTAPYCSWECRGNYPTICANPRIDSSDGLPVELLDFSIETETAGAASPPGQGPEAESAH
jgi:hypothetical protein